MPTSSSQSHIPRQAATGKAEKPSMSSAHPHHHHHEQGPLLYSEAVERGMDEDDEGEEEEIEETLEEEEVEEEYSETRYDEKRRPRVAIQQRTKRGVVRDHEAGKSAEVQYSSVATTVQQRDMAARRRALLTQRHGWSKWLPLAALASLGLLAFYVTLGRDLINGRRSHLFQKDGSGQDLRIYDLLRNAGVAPRLTLLEKVNDRQGWLLQMDVPGFTRNEINLYSTGPIMKIRGTHACPSNWRGREDPTCIERHISEEVRFPDEANMDTAQAHMDDGVLKVRVKPNADYQPRGRVVAIVDQAIDKVQSVGENLKEKLGFTSHPANSDDILAIRERAGKLQLTGREVEEVVRDKIESYLQSLERAFGVTQEKQAEFARRARSKTESFIQQFRQRTLSPEELSDRIFDAGEDVWSKLKDEAEDLSEDVRYKASQVQHQAVRATGAAKAKASEAQNVIAEKSSQVKREGEHVGSIVKGAVQDTFEAVQDTVEATKDKAREYADKMNYQAEYVAHRVEEAAIAAKHRAAEQLEVTRDGAKEAAHQALNKASETAERVGDRIKESTHSASHRASEAYERVQDRARENAQYVGNRADEKILHAENRAKEAPYAGRAKATEAKDKAKGFTETLKEKLGWAYQRAEHVVS